MYIAKYFHHVPYHVHYHIPYTMYLAIPKVPMIPYRMFPELSGSAYMMLPTGEFFPSSHLDWPTGNEYR